MLEERVPFQTMLPSTCAWSTTNGLAYPPLNSNALPYGAGRTASYLSLSSSAPTQWSSCGLQPPRSSGHVFESGFVPPSVDMRYHSVAGTTADWTGPSRKTTMSPTRGCMTIKDELTDASDYSSEDTCSDYRDTSSGFLEKRETGERYRKNTDRRNDVDDTSTAEDGEKRRIRRERNKLAAARCRQRRVDLTNQLLAETESLEDERDRLQKEIQLLQRQRAQLEDLLGTHAPRCQSRSLINSGDMIDIPQIKTEKSDDFYHMTDTPMLRSCGSYAMPSSTIFKTCNRPDSLPLTTGRSSCFWTAQNQATMTSCSTSSNLNIPSLGLDCMLDGHTGLTPITGAPSGCDQVVRTPVECGATSGNYSPTTLMTL